MNRNSHNSKGSSTHVRNPVPRWRIVFIALVLVLVFGSAGQTPPVQAAPPRERVYFSMNVQGPRKPLRCGKTVTYLVKVEVAPTNGAPTPVPGSFGFPKGLGVVNVKVEAFSVNKNVGDFVGTATKTTTMALDDDLTGLGAKFKFRANKPGKTTLHFEGLVGKEYVSAKLDVKVLPCKYKVTTIGEWHVPGEANLSIVAISDDAEVKADDDAQGSFTGSAAVNWVASAGRLLDCVGVLTIGNSQVDWTGEMDDVDRLTLISTYQPAAGLIDTTCANAEGSISGTFPVQLTPDPLQVNVASSAGVFRQSQVLQGLEATLGFVTIVVVPVDDEAVSFIPGNYEAGWDDFSSLFGALLALH